MSAIPTNDTHTHGICRLSQSRAATDQDSRSLTISPIELPTSNELLESVVSTSNSSANHLRAGIDTASRASIAMPSDSLVSRLSDRVHICTAFVDVIKSIQKETLLEKILQERLRLVQQMTELNKQQGTAQDTLAMLDAVQSVRTPTTKH
jgi:hypothetical protein